MSISAVGTIVTPPSLQSSVDRFIRGLQTQHKLLQLHPRTQGNPGNAAALSPAVVLGCIAAFEGFAEDFTALMMASQGSSFAEIAKKVGSWNNPSLKEFSDHMAKYFTLAAAPLSSAVGPMIDVYEYPYISSSTPLQTSKAWADALIDSAAWMQVRHLLTHGLTTGWRKEWWPGPLRVSDPPASHVLRDVGGGKHALGIYGAISCARIYSKGGMHVADSVARAYGQTLDWSQMPDFS